MVGSSVKSCQDPKKKKVRSAVKNPLPVNQGESDWSEWILDEMNQEREYRGRQKADETWEYEYRDIENFAKSSLDATNDAAGQKVRNQFATDDRDPMRYSPMPVGASANYGYDPQATPKYGHGTQVAPSDGYSDVTPPHSTRRTDAGGDNDMVTSTEPLSWPSPIQDAEPQDLYTPYVGPAPIQPLPLLPNTYSSGLPSCSDYGTTHPLQDQPAYYKTTRRDSPKSHHIDDTGHNRLEDLIMIENEIKSKFQVRQSKDFKIGTVFKILLIKPQGTKSNEGSLSGIEYKTSYTDSGQPISYAIPRFVVARNHKGHCICIGVRTYRGEASAMTDVCARDHCIIYTKFDKENGSTPKEAAGEPKLGKTPIRVSPRTKEECLDPTSRMNYAKIYTVEHNVKVVFIGQVHKDSMERFTRDFNNVFDKDDSDDGASISRSAGNGLVGLGAGAVGFVAGVTGTLIYVAGYINRKCEEQALQKKQKPD